MWAGIEEMIEAGAATGEELQGKFLQEGAGLLAYGGLSTFYGGLGKKIGDPNSKVDGTMEHEHTGMGDANECVRRLSSPFIRSPLTPTHEAPAPPISLHPVPPTLMFVAVFSTR